MAKTKKISKLTTSSSSVSSAGDLPTAADLALASKYMPSSRKTPVREVSTKFVDIYAAPPVQQGLATLASPLASFNGCGEVPTMLALATEGQAAASSFARLQAAADRVGQRVVQINQQLQGFDTALNRAGATAAPGTPVKQGLSSIAKVRASSITKKKTVRTKNKNKKASAKAAKA